MRRLTIEPRPDWQQQARDVGFIYHTPDGEPYWDETACYTFSLAEIEDRIERATEQLGALCTELVSRCVRDEKYLERLRLPRHAWDLIASSWKRSDPSLYGRFDFAYDGFNPPKLLEFNADTPTALFEAAVFQWKWLEDLVGGALPPDADQFNSLHQKLIDRWRAIGSGRFLHLACVVESVEDTGNIAYLEDCARQAGLSTRCIDVAAIGLRDGRFVDPDSQEIRLLFKLYPWEFMFADQFGKTSAMEHTRFVEPAWKCLLSNKGILALLWEMEPGHPNLLPAFFSDDAKVRSLGRSYAEKPIWSREGANVLLVDRDKELGRTGGTYGSEGFVRQSLADVPLFEGNYPILGSWLIGDLAAGMGIREDRTRITGDRSRFVPHAIV
jgi:glutathionylspermidine synthase